MKILLKLTLVVAAFSALATAAFADDQRLQNRLASEQTQNAPRAEQTTVAVYANHHAVGRADTNTCDQQRFELRSNGHGQLVGGWVEGK